MKALPFIAQNILARFKFLPQTEEWIYKSKSICTPESLIPGA
jgi:hypothetical protein